MTDQEIALLDGLLRKSFHCRVGQGLAGSKQESRAVTRKSRGCAKFGSGSGLGTQCPNP